MNFNMKNKSNRTVHNSHPVEVGLLLVVARWLDIRLLHKHHQRLLLLFEEEDSGDEGVKFHRKVEVGYLLWEYQAKLVQN